MFKSIFIIVIFISFSPLLGQLKGVVLDIETNEAIPFANIKILDLNTGVSADNEGSFIITNQISNYSFIQVTALGYADKVIEINTKTDRNNLEILLTPKHYHLHEAVVSTRTGVLQDYSVSSVVSRPIEEINKIKHTNLGEIISNMEGVYNASTGKGVYKPVIRGLSGIRVSSFLNGVRIENQQWGSDHGLGITSLGIGSIEVIKGPSSLLYGSDALGGVLYLKDQAFADNNSLETYVSSQFETNTMGSNNELGLKFNKNGLRFNTYVGYQNHADYELPNGEFVKTSRFKGMMGKFLIGYNKKNWVTNLGYTFTNNTVGIPGHTHDTAVTLASFLGSKQIREEGRPAQKITNHFITFDNQFFFDRSHLKITLGQTLNKLAEYEQFTRPYLGMNLNTSSYYIRYNYRLRDNVKLIVGGQGYYQTNTNFQNVNEIVVPNMWSMDNGIFGLISGSLQKLNYQLGVRYDSRIIETSSTPENRFNFGSINYSAGASYSFDKIKFRANISSGYRPPHVSELLSFGGHTAAQRFEIGNVTLQPEFGNQLDVAIEYQNEHLSLLVNPFINIINNFIYLQPADSTVDGFQVFYYEQVNQAQLAGGEISVHYHPHFLHHFHIESNYSMVYSEDQNGSAISFIPQSRLNSTLTYTFDFDKSKVFQFEDVTIQHQYFAEQNRVVDYERPSSAYQLVNLGVNAKLHFGNDELSVGCGVRNIFNEKYINHLSLLKNYQIPNPGRNIYLSLKYTLKSKVK